MCERQSENSGSMPLSTLNWAVSGQQLTSNGAWQRWMGLPEGASIKFRLNILMCLSETLRSFVTHNSSFARTSASPRADTSCYDVHRRRTLPDWAGVRNFGRWSASCRSAVTGQRALRNQFVINTTLQTIGILAGCFCSGVIKNNIPQVGIN